MPARDTTNTKTSENSRFLTKYDTSGIFFENDFLLGLKLSAIVPGQLRNSLGSGLTGKVSESDTRNTKTSENSRFLEKYGTSGNYF